MLLFANDVYFSGHSGLVVELWTLLVLLSFLSNWGHNGYEGFPVQLGKSKAFFGAISPCFVHDCIRDVGTETPAQTWFFTPSL